MRYAIDVRGYSERRACQLMEMNRRTFRRPPGPDRDAELRIRLRGLDEERRHFGTPRADPIAREGIVVNHKRVERVYREEAVAQAQAPSQAGKPSAGGAAWPHWAESALGHGFHERLSDERLQASYADRG